MREEVEKPAEETLAEKPAEEEPTESEEDEDGNTILDLGDMDENVEDERSKAKAKDEDEDEDEDRDRIITSNDSVESLNMAFTFLKYRHF